MQFTIKKNDQADDSLIVELPESEPVTWNPYGKPLDLSGCRLWGQTTPNGKRIVHIDNEQGRRLCSLPMSNETTVTLTKEGDEFRIGLKIAIKTPVPA